MSLPPPVLGRLDHDWRRRFPIRPASALVREEAVSPRNGYVYVANEWSNEVAVISGTQVITTIVVGNMPRFLRPDPVNGYVYVVDGNIAGASSRSVTIISGTTTLTNVTYAAPLVKTSFAASAMDPRTGYTYFAFQGDENQLLC